VLADGRIDKRKIRERKYLVVVIIDLHGDLFLYKSIHEHRRKERKERKKETEGC